MNALLQVRENAITVRERVRIAAERADRDPDEITIVAVSKTFDRKLVDEVYDLGFRIFGESRVQEIRKKFASPLPEDTELHMIGPLQTNKIRQLLPHIDVLQTVDREGLVDRLASELDRVDQSLQAMIQVNVSGESQKSGVEPKNLTFLLRHVLQVPSLHMIGLMTMAPYEADEVTLRRVFRDLRELRDSMQQHYGVAIPALSMGMSNDFEVAIAEGATHIRIGRALFGLR